MKLGSLTLTKGMQYVEVSGQDASTILETAPFSLQRALRPSHLETLHHAIKSHRFDQHTIIKIATLGGIPILVDGQHRLEAIKLANIPQKAWILIIECSTQDEVRSLYIHTDIGRQRTLIDGLRASGVSEEINCSQVLSRRGMQAMRLINCGFDALRIRKVTVDRDQMFQRLLEWQDQLVASEEATLGASPLVRRPLTNQPTLAVMLVTLRWAPRRAYNFWRSVADGDKLEVRSPQHTLTTFLATAKVKEETETIYAKRVAACWNAFVDGATLSHTQIKRPDSPIEIALTPATGRRFITYELLTQPSSENGVGGAGDVQETQPVVSAAEPTKAGEKR